MPDDFDEREERPRPRVVDKRVSARSSGDAERKEREPAEVPATETERPIEPPSQPSTPAESEPEVATGPAGARAQEVWTPEQEAEARRIAEEIARTPAEQWVVNTAVTLANVAATKLDARNLPDAQLTIDALTGLINEVGPRLGDVERPLRQTLSQLQMAYAEVAAKPERDT